MALASHDHVLVAVQPALGRTARDMGRKRCQRRPLRRLAFLAAKAPAHAPAFTRHHGIGNLEHLGDAVLNFGRMLGGGIDGHAALFFRHGQGHLPFDIEMLLPAHMETFRNHVGRRLERLAHIAMDESIFRHHIFGAHGQRVFNCDRRRFCNHFNLRQPRRAPGDFPRFSNNGKNHLAMKFNHTFGKDGIIAKRRAAIIDAGNILGRQHRNYAGKGTDCSKIKTGDFPARIIGRIARLHMQRAIGLTHVIDIGCRALNMQRGAVMGECQANRFRFKDAGPHIHLRRPPREARQGAL